MYGIGGGFGIIDSRFILRASVGLIVRAPRPVACVVLGIMESLLLEDDGVLVLPVDLAGERAVLIEDAAGGVFINVENWSCAHPGFGCIDLTLASRLVAGILSPSVWPLS